MCSDLQFCWTARTTNKSQHPIASRVNMKSGHSKPKLNSCKGLRLTLSTRVCVIFSYLHYQSHNPHQVHRFHPYKYLLMTSWFSSSLLHLLQEDIEIVLTLHKNRKPPYCSLHFCYIKKCICQLWFLRYMSQDIWFKKTWQLNTNSLLLSGWWPEKEGKEWNGSKYLVIHVWHRMKQGYC